MTPAKNLANALAKSMLMTKGKAKTKLCLLAAPPAIRVNEFDEPMDGFPGDEVFKTFCTPDQCMRWVQVNRVGFCSRFLDEKTASKALSEIFK